MQIRATGQDVDCGLESYAYEDWKEEVCFEINILYMIIKMMFCILMYHLVDHVDTFDDIWKCIFKLLPFVRKILNSTVF